MTVIQTQTAKKSETMGKAEMRLHCAAGQCTAAKQNTKQRTVDALLDREDFFDLLASTLILKLLAFGAIAVGSKAQG